MPEHHLVGGDKGTAQHQASAEEAGALVLANAAEEDEAGMCRGFLLVECSDPARTVLTGKMLNVGIEPV